MARLTRNANGTNYCEDCGLIVILFDDDTHECCGCSEEYGPCEEHGETIAQREGASTRTADDLVYVFLTDVLAIARDIDVRKDPRNPSQDIIAPDVRNLVAAVDYWSNDDLWDDNYGCRWVREDVDAEIHDEMYVGENVLAELGLSVWWEDGYVISRVTGGPLSE